MVRRLVLPVALILPAVWSFSTPLRKARQLHQSTSSLLRSSTDSTTQVPNNKEEKQLSVQQSSIDHGSVEALFLETSPKTLLGKSIPYEELTIGVMKESVNGESRVSLTPAAVEKLIKEGFHVLVQSGG